jgi:hypothetical protein
MAPLAGRAHDKNPATGGRAKAMPAALVPAALVLVLLSAFSLPETRAQSQSNSAPPSLLDMSITDLMSIDIDSVYGASGFV